MTTPLIEVSKDASGSHEMLGCVLVPDKLDSQLDEISKSEIAKCIAAFNLKGWKTSLYKNHQGPIDPSQAHIVESYQSVVPMVINNRTVPEGSWIIRLRISEELYQLAKAGGVTGFSCA